MRRYFKGTDGERTYFRASPSRAYASLTGFEPGRYGYSFHQDGRGLHPAVEITGKEYRALIALKTKRDPKGTAPSDSWVYNHDIEEMSKNT